jgi:hypothetical protein
MNNVIPERNGKIRAVCSDGKAGGCSIALQGIMPNVSIGRGGTCAVAMKQ